MEHHTGVHIAENLRKIAKDWNIDNKVVAVVHDNASNMVLASDLLEDWSDLPCLGHTLQLAVNAGLEIHTISRLTGVCNLLNDWLYMQSFMMRKLHQLIKGIWI